MRPEEILADIAHWHNDIHADWEQVEWWLYRVHASSRSSSQPVLARTNYVLIQGDDFLAVDMRPHGLVELAFGEDLILFSTFFPRWVNLSNPMVLLGAHDPANALWCGCAWVV